MFYEYDGSLSVNDSGYYFDYQDRRALRPLKDYAVNLTGLTSVDGYCDRYVMCGIPCFWSSWCRGISSAAWLPRDEEVTVPGNLELNLLNKTLSKSGSSARFEFELAGPPHMGLYIRTMTYYSNNWLVIGLYICPAIIGLVLPSTLYHSFKSDVSGSVVYLKRWNI